MSPALPERGFEPPRLGLRYFGQRDEPWLAALLDEHARYLGRKRVELRERLREPLVLRAPKNKLRIATQLLERLVPDVAKPRLVPREVRARLFGAAAQLDLPRAAVLAQVAAELVASVDELQAALLCDLAGERRLGEVPAELSPAHLAVLANHSLVARLLKRAISVRIKAVGNTGALARHARLLGLICNVSRVDEDDDALLLDISGPFALFRKTALYGRALSSLLPRAARCHFFELEARCAASRGQLASTFVVRSNDPIFPTRDLPAEGRRIDARFARDFMRARSDWQLRREPPPLEADGVLLFPDFQLVHRQQPERRFWLEILGFWTHQHLAEKLRSYRAAGTRRVILCVDERRRCSAAELPPMAHVVLYKNRIDVIRLLAVLDSWSDV